ncbi:hypothetical protein [Povalibacter sp.]|uniref:hypothetical protein n=1 Tax=Povalibacter sp. TaxID=1962978 RepID=UPI002F40808A
MRLGLLMTAASLAVAGCAGNGEGLDENGRPIDGGPVPLAPTFASIQQNVFTPICTGCHVGAQAPLGLRLDEASSYAMLVNAPSAEVPSLMRVRPGDPDGSYLLHKLQGSAAIGGRMPLGGPPLPQATIDVIRQWITDGAQQSVADAMPATLSAVSPTNAEILGKPPIELLVQASAELDTSRLQAGGVTLVASGHDGSFEEGNEVSINVMQVEVRSLDPTVLAILVPREQWTVDSYRFRIAGHDSEAITDRAGNVIDGDGDGAAGGDFVAYFELGGTL